MSGKKDKLVLFQRIVNDFGIQIALAIAAASLYPYAFHKNRFAKLLFDYKHELIINRLKSELFDSWAPITTSKYTAENDESTIFWTFWWQGGDDMPESVYLCTKCKEKYTNKHKVIVISKDNYCNFVQIPKCIMDKVATGVISFTHLSDIIRMKLLNEHGGLWTDAGVFPVNQIGNEWFQEDYYTRKHIEKTEANISRGRWCGSITAGKKGFEFFAFMDYAFEKYWDKHDVLIDYFLIDILTEIAYRNIPSFRERVDAVKETSPDLYSEEKNLNSSFFDEKESLIKSRNQFLRLKWRSNYLIKAENNESTLYEVLLIRNGNA